MDYILYFILTIGILVFIHELGHFLAAKVCRMRTDVFAIGFGKRLFGWNKINGFTVGDLSKDLDLKGHTDYRLSLLPLGGYVKISGMVDESFDTEFANKEPQPYEFRAKPTYQKLFVITAGVMMNLTLTLVIFSGINLFQDKPIYMTTTVGRVVEESIAAEAGFRTGDKIISIDGENVSDWEKVYNVLLLSKVNDDKVVTLLRGEETIDLTISKDILSEATQTSLFLPMGNTQSLVTEVLKDSPAEISGIEPYDVFLELDHIKISNSTEATEIIKSHKDVEMPLVILRGEDTIKTAVTPGIDGMIGIMIRDTYVGSIEYESYGLFAAIDQGVMDIIQYTSLTFVYMKRVIVGDLEVGQAFGGPVKIAQYAAQSADQGPISYLRFLALLSLSLAILNILPFPVLDGGHFVIILIEGIARREIPLKIKIAIQNAGFIILLILMAIIIYNDIINF